MRLAKKVIEQEGVVWTDRNDRNIKKTSNIIAYAYFKEYPLIVENYTRKHSIMKEYQLASYIDIYTVDEILKCRLRATCLVDEISSRHYKELKKLAGVNLVGFVRDDN